MHERTRPREGVCSFWSQTWGRGLTCCRAAVRCRAGEVVVARGTILHPARLGVLAAVGHVPRSGCAAPRIDIVPTGDELVEPGQARARADTGTQRRDDECSGD